VCLCVRVCVRERECVCVRERESVFVCDTGVMMLEIQFTGINDMLRCIHIENNPLSLYFTILRYV